MQSDNNSIAAVATADATTTYNDDVLMYSSTIGKAWKLVEQVMHETKSWRNNHNVTPIAIDDMVYMSEAFIEQRKTFLETAGCDCSVQLAFHYTEAENLSRIQTNGLLSRPERQAKGIESSRFNGAVHGEGIYLATDPLRTMIYGSVGLMVAIVLGKCQTGRCLSSPFDSLFYANRQFIVLRSSHQCIPLVRFPREMVTKDKINVLHACHVHMQSLLDQLFNDNPTEIPNLAEWQRRVEILPYETAYFQRLLSSSTTSTASPSYAPSLPRKLPPRTSPRRIVPFPRNKADFCYDGSMTISLIPTLHCEGYQGTRVGTIYLNIDLTRPRATHYQSYYPDTKQAQDLVKRLQFAFRRGYLFRTILEPRDDSDDVKAKPKFTAAWTVEPCPSWNCPTKNHQTTSIDEGPKLYFESNMAHANRQLDELCMPPAERLTPEGHLHAFSLSNVDGKAKVAAARVSAATAL